MSQDRPKVSLKKIMFAALSVVCLMGLLVGIFYVLEKGHNIPNIPRAFLVFIALWVGVVIFLNHLDDLINSKAPSFRLLLLFTSLGAWSVLIPFVGQGIWGGLMTVLSLAAIAILAEFFWSSRKMWYKTEIFAPIFWTVLLLGGYIDHIIEGPWSSAKIALISIRGILMLCLAPAIIGRTKSNLASRLNVRRKG